MFQIDEKVVADSRTLITIQNKKEQIDALTKNGTIHYTMDNDNLWLTTPKIRTAYVRKQDHVSNYDKIVLARNGVNIDGAYEFDDPIVFNDNVDIKKDLIVRGNFTVEGESSIIDTPRLTIEDNIIELNKNEQGNGISLRKAGVAINRGQKEFARVLYDDNFKAFVLDTAADMDEDTASNKWVAMGYTENSGEYVPGEFRARHRLTAPFAKITDSLSVSNQSNLNHLNVAGNSVFQGSITANGDHTVNGTFTSNGNAIFNNLLTANKVATFNDNVVMKKTLSVDGASTFNTLATFNEGINITSVGASITGPVDITGTLSATDNATLSSDLSVGGNTTSDTLRVNNLATVKTLTVEQDATIKRNAQVQGDLNVSGESVLQNGAEIRNTLQVEGTSNFNGTVTIDNGNDLIVDGGTLLAEGPAEFNNTVNINGNTTITENLSVSKALNVQGDITGRNVTTKNDFKVEQGDGKGLRFWDNDNYKLYMSASTSSVGGRLDSTSDYNMYFKMSSGTNRGFVFKNGNTPIVQIESTGQVRTRGNIIVNGHDVLTRENEGHKENGTGINADKLDDLHSTDFLRRNVDTNTTGTIEFKTAGKAINFNGGGSIFKNGAITIKTDNAINNGFKIQTEAGTDLLVVKDNVTTGLTYKGKKVWHESNQGHGSGLDADTLDGKHKEYFAAADHLHDDRYIRNDEVNLKGKYKIEYNEEFDSLDFMYMGDTN